MAEGKKGFVLYADLIDNIDHLTNEEKGILFNHLLEYVNDKNPVLEDRLILTAWKPIERQLKRDLEKWEKRANNSRENGKLGGRPKNPIKPTGLKYNPAEPKEPVIVNVKVNDTVTVNVKDKETLIKDVCNFFNVNEIKNFNTFKALTTFVNVSGIDSKTFEAYKTYKQEAKQIAHGWPAFIGSVEKQFADGMWASLDWSKQIKDIPQQSNGIPEKPIGNDYQIWLRKHGQNGDSWMEGCKKWRENGWEYIQPTGSTKRIWREIKQ